MEIRTFQFNNIIVDMKRYICLERLKYIMNIWIDS